MKKLALVVTVLMVMSSTAVAFASGGNGVGEKTQIKDTVQLIEKEQLQDESCIVEEEITLVTLNGNEVLVEDEKCDETQQRDRDRLQDGSCDLEECDGEKNGQKIRMRHRMQNTEMNKETNRNIYCK